MSWANRLLETYEICQTEIGKFNSKSILAPISHLTEKAQIEITLDENGNFLSADTVIKDEALTIIPVSEQSSTPRGSGNAPHPLHDELKYIAKDYSLYTNSVKSSKYYTEHQQLLKQWVTSKFTNITIQSIYTYLEKGCVVKDLISCNKLKLKGKYLDPNHKLQGETQLKAFVRFKLYPKDGTDDLTKEPWNDTKFFDNYINYTKSCMNQKNEKDLCYITGKMMYRVEKHPAQLLSSKPLPKLISSNDPHNGFKFQGRFANKKDAISVGYETSQKIHNVLRWLIRKQAYQKDELAILIWNAYCDKILSPVDDELCSSLEDENEIVSTNDVFTNEVYASRINRKIKGYENDIEITDDKIVIMAMDAATNGRLSITYYHELSVSMYYHNINRWYLECNWLEYCDSKQRNSWKTPLPVNIINYAFGTLKKDKMTAESKVKRMQIKLLLPCILEGRKIPFNIINQLNRQVKIMSSINEEHWYKAMWILCAVYKKYSLDLKGEEWSVDIVVNENRELDNVAYNYGRLLAIYDTIEKIVLMKMNENRSTNAMRLYIHFQDYPFKTWSIIDKKVRPYINKLWTFDLNKCEYLSKSKEEIAKILYSYENIESVRNLNASFVIGFDCQKIKFRNEEVEIRRKEKEKS